MEFRKIFDTIPEKFDKWRPRYCQEAFENLQLHNTLNTAVRTAIICLYRSHTALVFLKG